MTKNNKISPLKRAFEAATITALVTGAVFTPVVAMGWIGLNSAISATILFSGIEGLIRHAYYRGKEDALKPSDQNKKDYSLPDAPQVP